VENKVQIDTQYDDEIDLRELFVVLWTRRLKIMAITALFTFISVIYALSEPNQYKATVLLAPAQSDNSNLSGVLGQMGGLASFAGLNIGGGESNQSQIAQEIMKSWSFVEGFIADNDLAVEVYAVDGWNRESNQLQIDNDLYNADTQTWLVENVNTGEAGAPSGWELYRSFSERINVSEDPQSGLVSVSLEYYSPILTKQWLDLYISAINEHMQVREVEKVSNNISYLEAQIEKTTVAEMKDVFYSLIEEQLKNRMVAEASPDYTFVVVSPSMVPEEKSQPKRVLICILGTLLGGMLSSLLVLVSHYLGKSD
tara:strand:+ start:675 stop:1610 length:936 start_codon:yes stop_codon:yes gene_type:complete